MSDPFDALEEANIGIAQISGLRSQLIEQGWTESAAEQVVIASLKANRTVNHIRSKGRGRGLLIVGLAWGIAAGEAIALIVRLIQAAVS